MYRTIKNIVLIGILLIICVPLRAQTYPFNNFTVENGLSQVQVLSVFQDDDGVVWFGTNGGGITKFDGKFFENITDKEGLADNVVFCMAKDNQGRILIGTNNGLSVYDPKIVSKNKRNRIKNYTTRDGLSHNRILSITINNSGTATLGTAKGVSVFSNGTCVAMKINKGIDTSSVIHVLEDSKKNVWYSTLENGVFKQKEGQVKNFSTSNGLNNNMVFAVLERPNNIYWILSGEGICEIKDEEIKIIMLPKIGKTATYQCYLKDKSGNLWIGTSEGVLREDPNGSFEVYKIKNGLVDNNIWSIFQDKEENLWFASIQNGVSKLTSRRFFIYNSKDGLLFDEAKRVFQSDSNVYWAGTRNSLSKITPSGIENFTNDQMAGSADVWAITKDRDGKFLIGTTNGLCLFDGKNFKRFICRDKESRVNTVMDILVDQSGEIWLGTQAGVAKLQNGFIEPYEKLSISKNFINKIYQDNTGMIWFGTEDGLYMFDGTRVKQFTQEDGFTNKRISTIVGDKKNNIWFATGAGLFKYSKNKFTLFTAKAYNTVDEILSMAVDSKGDLWVGISNGIDKIRLSDNTNSIRHYDLNDGFIGQACSPNAMLIDDKERIFIGTTNGLVVYQPKYDKDNINEPKLVLKSIDLFYQKTDWTEFSDSTNINNIPYNLELPYDKNYLTFNFIGVSLTAPGKVFYKYKLKGLDNDWRESNKTEASYSNIPPGTYEFMVIANNGEGVWNKEPIVFRFTINPPFWRTWWFYSIIAIIILSGIYSYLKIRAANHKILKQNEIIEEKNDALLDANKEIAEKNQNITDSINYARRIQRSFLTSEKVLDNILNDYFILFKPRDIVSGDFYQAFDMQDRTVVVCADCTGHGIPGAFMSLIGISLLNEIARSNRTYSTEEILEMLRNAIINALNPEKSEAGGKDGMDVSLISIFKNPENGKIKIHFSGANNSLVKITNTHTDPQMEEFKGDKQPVGYYSNMKPFTHQEIFAEKGDMIYLYTDGYADQFGGLNGKKFMSKQLKSQLISICHLPLQNQREQLDNTLNAWRGRLEQVDDVTVIGVRI